MNIRPTLLFGLGLLLCLGALTYLYLNVPAGFPQPPFWSPRPNHSVEVSALYREALGLPGRPIPADTLPPLSLLLILLSFGCYVGATRTARRAVAAVRFPRSALAITVLILLVLLAMPPLFATDVFYYAISGQIAGEFGANPYLRPPADFPQSSLLRYNHWIDITTPYGPAWTLPATAITAVVGADPFLATLLFKLVGASSVLVAAYAIWTLLSTISPRDALRGTLLFLWNPVVLLEAVGNAHNDALMAALVMVAALLLYRRKYVLGFLPLVLATFVKYLVAPAAALYLVARLCGDAAGRHERWTLTLHLFALATAVTLLLWAPFWAGPLTVASLAAESSRGLAGPIAAVLVVLGTLSGLLGETARTVALGGSLLALVVVLLWGLRRMVLIWRKRNVYHFTDEINSWAYALMLVPVALPRSHQWFLLPAMALFAVIHVRAQRGTALTYTLALLWFLWKAGTW
ncbi:MAG TPA: hypothetical protein VLA19_26985 [Herpetosiphonaceae bacterium]|nr:hypothetical protein [Herpetosiphonaceae bacterium]